MSLKTSPKAQDDHLAQEATTTAVLTVDDTSNITTRHELDKDGFSTFGAVRLGVCVINAWVTLLIALGAGLTSGGPTASKSMFKKQADS